MPDQRETDERVGTDCTADQPFDCVLMDIDNVVIKSNVDGIRLDSVTVIATGIELLWVERELILRTVLEIDPRMLFVEFHGIFTVTFLVRVRVHVEVVFIYYTCHDIAFDVFHENGHGFLTTVRSPCHYFLAVNHRLPSRYPGSQFSR